MERRIIVVQGLVQGVGFRPFVHHLAQKHRLGGLVRNSAGAVHIEVEGDPSDLDHFLTELASRPPSLARIERIAWQSAAVRGTRSFSIEESRGEGEAPVAIAPDLAPCTDCWREFHDPNDRRYRYPFLNCTNCGPRLTIITGAPYDRVRTTLAHFPLCPDCQREYHDPGDRRFHAQPIACPACGPRLELRDAAGRPQDDPHPLAIVASLLLRGQIGAVKGVGGYHLVCDARSETAVAELRRRKHREQKPLAIMVADTESARAFADVSSAERELLESQRRPIVLLRRRPGADVAWSVAPGNPYLGVMLPPSPLHEMLADAVGRIPLVMTSGNQSDEPIATDDDDACERLRGIADFFLTHNRPIHVRCDDSVTRVIDGVELPIRRSRGETPCPMALPRPCSVPTLAVGGQLKAVFALGRDRQAILSHHLGDLDHLAAWRAFERDLRLYEELFRFQPRVVVHDLHPDYLTTRYAEERARRDGLMRLAVQHHHAHLASCLAEHGWHEPAIGVTFDGTGYGTDGAIWGGEFLVGDDSRFYRAAHLRYVPMPGGEKAIREPWRMALAQLRDARTSLPAWEHALEDAPVSMVERLLERPVACPITSSMGRLFDAVASLVGLARHVSHEGQAAMQLEWLAEGAAEVGQYPFDLVEGEGTLVIDTRPLIAAVAHDIQQKVDPAIVARRFHDGIARMVADVCRRLRESTGHNTVVLTGGVFQNALLTRACVSRLQAAGFCVLRHQRVPPGDGGLALGQLAVAAAILSGAS